MQVCFEWHYLIEASTSLLILSYSACFENVVVLPAFIMRMMSKTWSCDSLAAGEQLLFKQLQDQMADGSVSLDDKIAAASPQPAS